MQRWERDQLLARLRADAHRIADRFGLVFRGIAAEHPRVRSRYGVCFSDGLIKIRLNHARTGAPLKYSSLIDTLCHELAHLRHFNHGPEFQRFFWQLLGWARRQGIYRPAARRPDSDAPPRPALLARRNGVPIFGSEASGEQQPRWTELLSQSLTRRPEPTPEAQAPTPRQLSLF